ncbi:hypothetical protein QJS83_17335 [Bdellovibrio sp. 22V]|uniref:hypothetical protein n=1 Tax=Bdellovibrio TaxID=958 RepID=UPI002543E539|nr:hypothetical protein [Bdellovibrio sp. 22V]WII72229.1 hypothetical protein QJS83_17335 [Bdellovibrio sp. 22V]
MVSLEQLPHPEYLPYPNHYTAAFFENAEAAEKAIEQLEELGFTEEDFNIFEGDQGVDAVDIEGTHHTLLEKFMRKFIKFSDSAEWRFLHEADQEIRNGHILLCVPTPKEEDKDDAIAVFKRTEAYDIRYFTPLYIEEVV